MAVSVAVLRQALEEKLVGEKALLEYNKMHGKGGRFTGPGGGGGGGGAAGGAKLTKSEKAYEGLDFSKRHAAYVKMTPKQRTSIDKKVKSGAIKPPKAGAGRMPTARAGAKKLAPRGRYQS